MTPEQEQSIRERHSGCDKDDCLVYRGIADQHVPCDTAVVLAALDRAEAASMDDAKAIQELGQMLAALDEYRQAGVTGPGTLLDGYERLKAERDAAIAREQELADVLHVARPYVPAGDRTLVAAIDDALHAHEEATR